MSKKINAGALGLALVMSASAACAAEVPYFRFIAGEDVPSSPGAKTQDQGNDLAFSRADAIPGGTVGTPVSANFVASGGTPPYAMTLLSAPQGVTLSKVADGSYQASGTLSPVGTYATALVRLTDSAGHRADFPVPVTVTDVAPPQVQALAFDAKDPLPSGNLGTRVRSYFSAVGGKAPYQMKLVQVPSGISFSQVGSIAWSATGSLGQVGDFQTAVVNLVDSAGTEVTLPVPLTVTQPDPLAFTQTNDFPASFPTYTQQSAAFTVGGGSAPYAWSLSSAPTTVIASGSTSGTVVGSVEAPGNYSGVTLTVTDAAGATISRVLAPFTVTDPGTPHLDVTGLTPLPATMNVGDGVNGTFQVTGVSDPNTSVSAVISGASQGVTAYAFQTSYGSDPVTMYSTFIVNAPGVYDVYIQLTDQGDTTRQKLVHWGKTTVTATPLTAVSQFQTPVTGTGGTSATVYARFKGSFNNANVALAQPDGLGASAMIQYCNQYSPCDPSTGGQDGEAIVGVSLTFPPPGTYPGVRVSVTDDVGEKIFFDPFDVVSTPPQPFRIVKQFDTPIRLQAGVNNGVYMDTVYGVFTGGSPAATASVNIPSPNLSNLSTQVMDCGTYTWVCAPMGYGAGTSLVGLEGYLYNSGSYPGITVKLSDPALATGASFDPVTIVIAPNPIGNCSFKALASLSDSDNTVPAAVTFTGGVAPYAVTASVDGITFGPDLGRNGTNHGFDATIKAKADATSAHVTVTDSIGGTCSQDVAVNGYKLASGDGIPVVVVNEATNPYGNVTSFLVTQSSTNDITANMNDSGTGPLGAHPSPDGVVLQFVPPGGQSVQGYSLYSSNAPVASPLYGPFPLDGDLGAHYPPNPAYLYTNNLQNKESYQLPAADYTYRYYVYLSDGTYMLSAPFTTHVLYWPYAGEANN